MEKKATGGSSRFGAGFDQGAEHPAHFDEPVMESGGRVSFQIAYFMVHPQLPASHNSLPIAAYSRLP